MDLAWTWLVNIYHILLYAKQTQFVVNRDPYFKKFGHICATYMIWGKVGQCDWNCAQSQSKRLSVKLRVTLVSWVLLGTIKQTWADIKFVTARNQSLQSTNFEGHIYNFILFRHIIDNVSIILTEIKVTNCFINNKLSILHFPICKFWCFFQISNPVLWQVPTKWKYWSLSWYDICTKVLFQSWNSVHFILSIFLSFFPLLL